MVGSASGGPYDVDSFNVPYVAQSPSYGLGLVVVFLFGFLYDYVRIFFLESRRERVHISDHKVRQSLFSKDGRAVSYEFTQ